MKKIKMFLLSGVMVALAIVPLLRGTALAGSDPLHIALAEGVSRVELVPNTVTEGSFTLINRGTDRVDISVAAGKYNIEAAGTSTGKDNVDRNQLYRWITITNDKFSMAPGEKKTVNYSVETPEDIPSGGQYATIVATASIPGASDVAGVSNKIGVAVNIFATTTGGDTRVSARLIAHEVPRFYLSGPIGATAKIENTGNTDVQVSMKLKINDIFFKDNEIYNNDIKEFSVFPGTTRSQANQWSGAPMLGLFRVKSTISFLGENYDREETVIIFPLFLIIILLIIIALIIVAVVLRIKKRNAERQAAEY